MAASGLLSPTASARKAQESHAQTLQPTSLVPEAWLRLAGDDLFGVNARLDDLQSDLASNRLVLRSHEHHATITFPNLLEQLVMADASAQCRITARLSRCRCFWRHAPRSRPWIRRQESRRYTVFGRPSRAATISSDTARIEFCTTGRRILPCARSAAPGSQMRDKTLECRLIWSPPLTGSIEV